MLSKVSSHLVVISAKVTSCKDINVRPHLLQIAISISSYLRQINRAFSTFDRHYPLLVICSVLQLQLNVASSTGRNHHEQRSTKAFDYATSFETDQGGHHGLSHEGERSLYELITSRM